ncbi:WD40-repeat-containing domain protein [Hygrophoropsis aurantiaca]|uniref:WD40-repeat-containing domain protein n=1 Tax=Hygrophoropsis aurantiaca TaxID=72124 RepID=A0ACB7ZZF6_9AGAM|nr:WD40-repeat-containing domain protein [Hygrophoropsis aurantiaca]
MAASGTAYVRVKTFQDGHSETINILAFSPCGTYLASGSEDQSLIIWRISDGTQLCRFTFDSSINFLVWHPALIIRNTVFCGTEDGVVYRMSDFSVTKFTGRAIKLGVKGSVHCLDFEPRTRVLAVGIANEVRLTREMANDDTEGTFDATTKIPQPGFSLEEGAQDRRIRPRRVHFFDGGRKLIVVYLNHGVIAWDLKQGSQVWRIPPAKDAPQMYVCYACSAISLDINALVVQTLHGGLYLYRLGRTKPIRKFPFIEETSYNYPLTVSFLHQGQAIVCGSNSGNVHIWKTHSGEVFQILTHNSQFCFLGRALRPPTANGPVSLVATASALKGQQTYIGLWSAKSGRCNLAGLIFWL